MSDGTAEAGLVIQSHKGPYTVAFCETVGEASIGLDPDRTHFLIDERIAALYADELRDILAGRSVLRIAATEENKSLDRFPEYVSHLVSKSVRRDHQLCAIGGGIVQDITCFLAATLLRGVEWRFLPTTLLAQADSCIGSKSSINASDAKNILGTFTPPREVRICGRFLRTLDEVDVRSGVGEILKVHAIEGPSAFDGLAGDYEKLFGDAVLMQRYIRRALAIKQRYIEIDEFDRAERNVFNYGHSFGHAIEAATDFAVPHGIAVTMGMDMANFVARRANGDGGAFDRMHATLRANYRGFEDVAIPADRFFAAIAKDKKNVGGDLMLILPDDDGVPAKTRRANDETFRAACGDYFATVRTA